MVLLSALLAAAFLPVGVAVAPVEARDGTPLQDGNR